MRQQKINYQKELEKTLEAIRREERVPTLLLHSCCGPCSSYVMEYLADFFRITVFYFNPNITDKEEYRKRAEEQRRLIERMNEKLKYPVSVLEGEYDAHTFFEMAKGMEHLPEGGERVFTVMPCGWNARQQRQRREEWIILLRRFPSVR